MWNFKVFKLIKTLFKRKTETSNALTLRTMGKNLGTWNCIEEQVASFFFSTIASFLKIFFLLSYQDKMMRTMRSSGKSTSGRRNYPVH